MSQGNTKSHEGDVPRTPTGVVAARVEQVRSARGWSTADLAARMAALGYKWDRFTVRNLERGRRQKIALDEVFALAYVLDVSPINLMTPVEDETVDNYEVAPSVKVRPLLVRDWIRGMIPLPGQDEKVYFTEISPQEAQMQRDLIAQLISGTAFSQEFREQVARDYQEGRFLPIISNNRRMVTLFTIGEDPADGQR